MSAGCTKCQHGEPCYAVGHEVRVYSQTGRDYYYTAKVIGSRKYQVNDDEFWCYSFQMEPEPNSDKVFWQTCHTIDPFLDQLNDLEKL